MHDDGTDDGSGDGRSAAEQLLAALLHIPAEEAARIRDVTQTRVRPRRQAGPTADYGDSPD